MSNTDALSIACRAPLCGRIAAHRGLCDNCYKRAMRRVRQGLTTWADLEASGQALPPKGKFQLRKRR